MCLASQDKSTTVSVDDILTSTLSPSRAVLEIFPHLCNRQHLLGGDPQLLSVLVIQHIARPHWPFAEYGQLCVKTVCR